MHIMASTVKEYLENVDPEKRDVLEKVRKIILDNIPEGFEETMQYGMISYVVPHHLYPAGYHVNPKEALPFISLAAQKNHYSIYMMHLYSDH